MKNSHKVARLSFKGIFASLVAALSAVALASPAVSADTRAAGPPNPSKGVTKAGYTSCDAGERVTITGAAIGNKMYIVWGPATNPSYTHWRKFGLGVVAYPAHAVDTDQRYARWYVQAIGKSPAGDGPVFADGSPNASCSQA